MDCRVNKQGARVISVRAANGKESNLFWAMAARLGDTKKALSMYAAISTERFQTALEEKIPKEKLDAYRDSNGEISVAFLPLPKINAPANIKQLAHKWNINENGFTKSKKMKDKDITELKREARNLGFGVKQAKSGAFYLTLKGKKQNPWKMELDEPTTWKRPTTHQSQLSIKLQEGSIWKNDPTVHYKSQIVRMIRDHGSEYSNQLLNIIEDKLSANIHVVLDPTVNPKKGGTYDPMSKRIRLHPGKQDLEAVIMHELMHDATVHVFKLVEWEHATPDQVAAVEALKANYAQFKNYVKQDRGKGMTLAFGAEASVEEFVADLFTDRNLQAYLQKKRSNAKLSLWDRIVKNLLRLIGIKNGTAAEEAIVNAYTLLGVSPQNQIQFEGEFTKLDDRAYQFYTSQLDKMEPEQKAVMKKIIELQARYELHSSGEYYTDILSDGTPLMRVSNKLDNMQGPQGQENYYGFNAKYDSGLWEKNRQWGNQTDMILEGIVLEKSYEEIFREIKVYQQNITSESRIPDNIIMDSYNEFKRIIAEEKARYPGIVFMSQITMGNKNAGVAGTMDLIGIRQDGKVEIYDLKTSDKTTKATSIDPITGETINGYKTISLSGQEVINSYSKSWKESSSKKGRHTAQLSLYKAILFSKGIPVVGTNIIALKLGPTPSGGTDIMSMAKVEEVHRLDAMRDIVKANSYDEGFQSAYAAGQSLNELESTAHKIQLALQKKMDDYISKNNESGALFIRRLQAAIRGLEEIKAIEAFINEAFRSVHGHTDENGNTIWKGHIKQGQEIIADIHQNKIAGIDALQKLYDIKDILQMYQDTLNDIRQHYRFTDKFEGDPDKLSTIQKLSWLRNALEDDLPVMQSELNHLSAKILARVAGKADVEVKKAQEDKRQKTAMKINRWRKEQKEFEKDSRGWNRIQGYIDKATADMEDFIRRTTIDYETIKYQLDHGADKDVGIINAYLTPGIQSDNPVIATYVRLLKDEFEANRFTLRATQREAQIAFTDYLDIAPSIRDNPKKFNEGLYTVVSIPRGKDGPSQHYSFISEIDYEAYEASKSAMFKKAKEITNEAERRAYIDAWKARNEERVPQEDTFITNPYTGKKEILHMGEKSLRAYLKKVMTQNEIDQMDANWRASGVAPKMFIRPKASVYRNAKYDSLTGEKKKYHDWLLYTYTKSQKKLPRLNREYEKYFIPTRLKDEKEHLINSPKAFAKYQVQKFRTREEDIEKYGKEQSEVPVLFRYTNMPLEDVSLDLLRSVMMFEEEALNYETRTKLLGLSRHLLENFKENAPAATDTSGKPILSKARANLEKHAERLGIPNFNDYLRKNNNSHIAAAMEGLIDMHIYGKFKKKQISDVPIVGHVDWGKWTDFLISFSSFTQVGITNPLLGVANSLMAETQVLIEAMAQKHYNLKDWAWAEAYYDKNIPNMLADFSRPANKSLIGQLIDLYDPIQGEFLDMMGRKMTSSAYSKALSTNSWFWIMRQGEHHAQVKSLIAMLRSTKVIQNGKQINLIDAYELDGKGEIKLKEGVVLGADAEAISEDNPKGLVAGNVKNRLHSINKGMHGNYNAFDRVIAERDAFGRLLTMYRKFVVTGFKRRYDMARVDHEQDIIVEGHYRTFYKVMMRDFQQMMLHLIPGTESHFIEELTELEKENLRRAAVEFAFIMTTGAALMTFNYLPPPEEEDEGQPWAANIIRYEIMRLNAELGFFMGPGDPRMMFAPNPFDTYRMFKTPVIAIGTVNKALKLVMQLTDPFERYQRDAGIAQKGDLKLQILFWKLLGRNGYLAHPDQAIKVLQLQLN